ncbi:hypothetical protein LUD75_18975 [Epilithonimonas sp. JDS]|uniref:hypothetical protein n=1 Tax=Epilithonimonas sp. JDS TaxID=2902797 RepID=UPI001E51D553|nr:hypothetical protein [Epilithonimonas sp. JDS]MCD9856815.1 hypothetical protein [Epilithonimonas sp. JDS]
MERKPHFRAALTYLPTDQGGIVTPVSSDFRANIRFPYDNKELTANQTFVDAEIVFPGDTISADIFLLKPTETLERIYAGLDFDLLINSKIIGSGIIANIYPFEA